MSFFGEMLSGLMESVGNNRVNKEDDVRSVRTRLRDLGHRTDDDKADGIFTRPLHDAIMTFQRDEGLKDDGWLRPNGPTIRAMDIRLAQNGGPIPLIEVRPFSQKPKRTIDNSLDDNEIIDSIKDEESYVPWPYVDTEQNVTIGIGKKLPTVEEAQKLPIYIKKPSGFQYATPREIEEGFQRLKNLGNSDGRFVERYYEDKTPLLLSPVDALEVTRQHLKNNRQSLIKKFPKFDDYSTSVKRNLYDFDYNIGSNGFTKDKWPKLFDAIDKGNWEEAAKESHRKGISAKRNNQTFKNFIDAAKKK